jgi:hypothetical protein
MWSIWLLVEAVLEAADIMVVVVALEGCLLVMQALLLVRHTLSPLALVVRK